MKVAIVYDRVNKWGGAERVLLSLHDLFPNAPLYTSVYDPNNAPWANVFPKVVPSFLQKIKILRNKHELLGTVMPMVFESFNFNGYDLVISVTSEAAKGIIAKGKTKHICYCLTPTRYLWSGYETYFPKRSLLRLLAKPVVNYLRLWDKIAAQRPDEIIGISTEVCRRITKYYQREAVLIFPPVTQLTKKQSFHNKDININITKNTKFSDKLNANKPYYLIVSRLVRYKKVDLAIRVFNKTHDRLIIVGKGAMKGYLKKIARNNIEFINKVSDEELAVLYKGARALIFPQEEDFGIVAVEALSFGTPIIAYKRGGILDIIDKSTGIFFNQQNETSLISALWAFRKQKFNKDSLIERASLFSEAVFKKQLMSIINKTL